MNNEAEVKIGKTEIMALCFALISGFLICALLFWDEFSWKNMNIKVKGTVILILIFAPIELLNYSRYFGVTGKGINCYIFGIKFRHIPWTQITQIGIGYARGFNASPFVILTLKGCPKFVPGRDYGGKYISKHPFKTVTIHEARTSQPVLEKYYGPLDYGRLEVKLQQKD